MAGGPCLDFQTWDSTCALFIAFFAMSGVAIRSWPGALPISQSHREMGGIARPNPTTTKPEAVPPSPRPASCPNQIKVQPATTRAPSFTRLQKNIPLRRTIESGQISAVTHTLYQDPISPNCRDVSITAPLPRAGIHHHNFPQHQITQNQPLARQSI